MRPFVLLLLATATVVQAPPSLVAQAQPAPNAAASTSPGGVPMGPRAVGTMSEFMLDIVYPTSDQIFYVGRNEEKTGHDWIELRHNALMLAEAANILMSDTRARDKDRWMTDAQLLWDVGNKAYKLAKAKDLEGLKALNADLYEACQSCHEHYRPGYRRRP